MHTSKPCINTINQLLKIDAIQVYQSHVSVKNEKSNEVGKIDGTQSTVLPRALLQVSTYNA